MGRLDARVAVITGGGDGIGAGMARRFAEEGARVVIAEMNEERGRTNWNRDLVRSHRCPP
jgi:NAD(P)-dependent dehydrogenase (short-subunit alcohol dehydrogenase family)